jgi:hypothetical protein
MSWNPTLVVNHDADRGHRSCTTSAA